MNCRKYCRVGFDVAFFIGISTAYGGKHERLDIELPGDCI